MRNFTQSSLLILFTVFSTNLFANSSACADPAHGPLWGVWGTNCVKGVNPLLNLDLHTSFLDLDEEKNGFAYQENWYDSTKPNDCASFGIVVSFLVTGTYKLGVDANGNQSITFQTDKKSPSTIIIQGGMTGIDMTPYYTAFNNDCGKTSPFCKLSQGECTPSSATSNDVVSAGMSCKNFQFPSIKGSVLKNMYMIKNGVLMMSVAPYGLPGVLSPNAPSSDESVSFYPNPIE